MWTRWSRPLLRTRRSCSRTSTAKRVSVAVHFAPSDLPPFLTFSVFLFAATLGELSQTVESNHKEVDELKDSLKQFGKLRGEIKKLEKDIEENHEVISSPFFFFSTLSLESSARLVFVCFCCVSNFACSRRRLRISPSPCLS